MSSPSIYYLIICQSEFTPYKNVYILLRNIPNTTFQFKYLMNFSSSDSVDLTIFNVVTAITNVLKIGTITLAQQSRVYIQKQIQYRPQLQNKAIEYGYEGQKINQKESLSQENKQSNTNSQQNKPNKIIPSSNQINSSTSALEVPYMNKRPRNAYNIFVQSESIKIKKQFPHLRAPDIVRAAAERYNQLTEEEKKPYLQKFQQAKRIFDQQRQHYGPDILMPQKKIKHKARKNYSLK